MEIRLHQDKGGDGTIHRISVVHDTGSTVMAILETDRDQLGNMQNYTGVLGNARVGNSSGVIEDFPHIWIQFRLLNEQQQPITERWFTESALVRPARPRVPRLSGSLIRNYFLFATPLGNDFVAVSTSKTGLASLL